MKCRAQHLREISGRGPRFGLLCPGKMPGLRLGEPFVLFAGAPDPVTAGAGSRCEQYAQNGDGDRGDGWAPPRRGDAEIAQGHRPLVRQTGDRRGVSTSAAVVDVVGAEAGPDELLHGVGRLVGRPPGRDPVDRLAAVPLAHLPEPGGGGVERLVPAALVQLAVGPAQQRSTEAVRVLHERFIENPSGF